LTLPSAINEKKSQRTDKCEQINMLFILVSVKLNDNNLCSNVGSIVSDTHTHTHTLVNKLVYILNTNNTGKA